MDTTLHSPRGSTSHGQPRIIAWLLQSWARPATRPGTTTDGWPDTIAAVWAHDGTTNRCWPADRGSRSGGGATRTQRGD